MGALVPRGLVAPHAASFVLHHLAAPLFGQLWRLSLACGPSRWLGGRARRRLDLRLERFGVAATQGAVRQRLLCLTLGARCGLSLARRATAVAVAVTATPTRRLVSLLRAPLPLRGLRTSYLAASSVAQERRRLRFRRLCLQCHLRPRPRLTSVATATLAVPSAVLTLSGVGKPKKTCGEGQHSRNRKESGCRHRMA